mgnify:CR=1 FL=1
MNKKRNILIISAVVITLGFLINHLLASRLLPTGKELSYDWKVPADTEIYTTMFVSKKWDESPTTVGAQYDWVIINTSSHDVRDWTITLKLPADTYIDSIWNVDYTLIGETLTLTPLDYLEHIESGDDQSFGMVLISPNEFVPGNVRIHYDIIYAPTSLPLFPALIFAAFVWLLFLVQYLSEERVLKKEQARRELDKATILQSMNTFINFIDAKDPYTKGHSQRVATIAAELGRRLGYDDTTVSNLYYAGILHDSGKIGIPDGILKKVGILTPDEYAIIQKHANIGGSMLAGFTSIEGIREAALYHHERYAGSGYPEGLRGDDIPLFGRVVCVADTYDAMARDRCYRKHLTVERMLDEFRNNSGTQFDPTIVSQMIKMIEDGSAERLTAEL